ncbi:MAG: hypothetical protein KKC28_14705 [Verrucomicrobia bacterium]|nr:hypothetical protein [Verrucomicrobiota bacterium]
MNEFLYLAVTGTNIPQGVDWTIIPVLTDGAGIPSSNAWQAEITPGNVATNYKVRATSKDNASFYDEVNLQVWKIDIVETNIYVAVSNTVSLHLTPDSSLDAQWTVIPSVQNGASIQGSSVGTSVVVNAGSIASNYMVKAYAPDFSNCYDTCSVTVLKVESIQLVSGATSSNVIPTNTWADIKDTNSPTEYVVVRAEIEPDIDPTSLPADFISWSGGEEVTTNQLQRKVPKNVSAHTELVATCGGSSATGHVWIIWAELEIRTTGSTTNTPNSARFESNRLDKTESLGAVVYDYLIPDGTQYVFWAKAAAGKVIPIGKLQPSDVYTVVSNGFTIERYMKRHEYIDGNVWTSRWCDAWTFDSYTQDEDKKYNPPDSLGQIYDLDAPNITKFISPDQVLDSCERYDHFKQYVTWNGAICSSNALWHWFARWKDNTNLDLQINLKDIDVGNPDFPSGPYYNPP